MLVHLVQRTLLQVVLAMVVAIVALTPEISWAISLGLIDDFTSGTEGDWNGAAPLNLADPNPAQVGDRALKAQADGGGGSGSRLVLYNSIQWAGDWTSSEVRRVSMDVLNPNPSGELIMRLGIAGQGIITMGGFGPTYGTLESFAIPADNQWHQVIFDVNPTSWIAIGGTNIVADLANVTQFRILHSPTIGFTGQKIEASFLVDNITALGPASVDGDYNGNAIVDAADYALWRDTLGEMGDDLPADGNGDLTVNTLDYGHWKQRFGNESGSGAEEANGSLAIPEPAAASIALMLLLVIGLWRWFDLRAAGNGS